MKRLIQVLFLLILLGLAAPLSAAADTWKDFYIANEAGVTLADGRPVDCVYTYVKKSGKRYLFIPGAWDAHKLQYVTTGDTDYYVDGKLLESGQITDVFVPGTTVTLTDEGGRKKYPITVMQGSEIASIFLLSESGTMTEINKRNVNAETGEFAWHNQDGKVYADHLTQLKKHGNSSAAFPKKSYQIKLNDKVDLTGSGEGKTWILLADYMDMALLRNRITLDMAAFVGLPYALDCESVDVYACGEYQGVYLLTEKVQIGEARIDITNLEEKNEEANENPPETYETFRITNEESLPVIKGYRLENDPDDITGGYIIEIEKPHRFNSQENNGFETQSGMTMVVKEPTCASEAQIRYVGEIFSAFHRAINTQDGIDPVTGMYYLDRFDLDSLVKKYMLEEISKNFDAHGASQFFFKDSDSVDPMIYAGPAWDYDLTYGNFNDNGFTTAAYPHTLFINKNTRRHIMYNHLYKFDDFYSHLIKVYESDYRPALETLTGTAPGREDMQLKSIDEYAAEIAASARMNGQLWNSSGRTGYIEKAGTNFDEAVKYLKQYLEKRLAFLNEEWGAERN